MPERRETDRKNATRRPSRSKENSKTKSVPPANWEDGERIAKYLARAGVCSRRDAERLIEDGKVIVNGERLMSPAFKVTGRENILVNGDRVKRPDPTRLWRYHKPSGLVTTNADPEGRPTVFEQLPKSLPRVITVGRLDLTTEGLLLLTNNGELARALELPDNGLTRRYRARAHGRITQDQLDTLASGITVEGTDYAPIKATLERQTGTNNWIEVELTEGKKREVRFALESLGLQVNRLIRTSYGTIELGALKPGAVEEIPATGLHKAVGPQIAAALGIAAPQKTPGRSRGRVRSRVHRHRD